MGALIFLLACAWPSSAPSSSQPLIVEVYLGDTAITRMAPEAGAPQAEAAPAGVASPEARSGEPEAKAEAGLGGVP